MGCSDEPAAQQTCHPPTLPSTKKQWLGGNQPPAPAPGRAVTPPLQPIATRSNNHTDCARSSSRIKDPRSRCCGALVLDARQQPPPTHQTCALCRKGACSNEHPNQHHPCTATPKIAPKCNLSITAPCLKTTCEPKHHIRSTTSSGSLSMSLYLFPPQWPKGSCTVRLIQVAASIRFSCLEMGAAASFCCTMMMLCRLGSYLRPQA